MRNQTKPVALIHFLLYVSMLLFSHKRALAEENRPSNESYQIRYDDVIKVRLDLDRQDRYLASYEEIYPYDIDSLSSACKGNAAEMHVVTAVGGSASTEPNRYWRLLPSHGTKDGAQRGNLVKNGDIIRLQNVKTQRNLHAQGCPSIKSPLEMQISTCLHNGSGDVNADWKIEFNKTDTTLEIGKSFILRHNTTGWILHAKNNPISEKRGGWIEVAAYEQSVESDSLPDLSLWHAEKRMSDPAHDSCASSERPVVLRKIESIASSIQRTYQSRYENALKDVNTKFVFNREKFNSTLKSSLVDLTGKLFSDGIGMFAMFQILGESAKKDKVKLAAAVTALFVYKAGVAAWDATSRGPSNLGDEMSAQRDKYLKWIATQQSRSSNYPIESLQAVCVRLERNLLTDAQYDKFLTSAIKLIQASK